MPRASLTEAAIEVGEPDGSTRREVDPLPRFQGTRAGCGEWPSRPLSTDTDRLMNTEGGLLWWEDIQRFWDKPPSLSFG